MGLLTRPFAAVGRWLSDHPLRLFGGLAAVAGSAATYLGIGAETTAAELLAFTSAQPAYVAAIVLGVATLLFVDG